MAADDTIRPPIPIFRTPTPHARYIVFEADVAAWLRSAHNILGVLIGTLPQVPSQNVFLGLPLELLPEEVRWLQEQGLAFVVDDRQRHDRRLRQAPQSQIETFRREEAEAGLALAREHHARKQLQVQQALERAGLRDNRKAKQSRDSVGLASEDEKKGEEADGDEVQLFDTATTKDERSFSPVAHNHEEASVKAWTTTPTSTSTKLFSLDSCRPEPFVPVSPHSYALFRQLHERGYVMLPGLRFGCQFSVYPGDPLRFHSHFLARSFGWNQEMPLLDIIGGGRLGTGVKKGYLLGGIEPGDRDAKQPFKVDDAASHASEKVRTFCIEWGGM